MFETVVAAGVLFCCAALLVRLLMPAGKRQRIDLWARRAWLRARLALTTVPRQLWRRRQTEREARELINRARQRTVGRGAVKRDGNVYRPDAFKPPPNKDKLH